MPRYERFIRSTGSVLVALVLLNGCKDQSTTANSTAVPERHVETSSRSLSSGTHLLVALSGAVSSETANAGDAWHGTLTENVPTSNGGVIAAGSEVDGVVSRVTRAERGERAMLDLSVRHLHVDGRSEAVSASAEAVTAGSTRARNLGAIAGSAVAGALIGKAVGDGKNGAVGGLIGGGVAAGVVAGSKGYQVTLPDGLVMSFTVSQTVAMR